LSDDLGRRGDHVAGLSGDRSDLPVDTGAPAADHGNSSESITEIPQVMRLG
jgi:hypothetical protein